MNYQKKLYQQKDFSSGIFQNYSAIIPAKKTLNILVALLTLILEIVMECQKKVLKI